MKTTQTNVRQRLKIETAQPHKRLDDMMSARGPFDSAENYHWYLCGMHALYRHCESSITWVQQQANLPERGNSVLDLVRRDLATLNLEPLADAPLVSHEIKPDQDAATQWARAYVMEGSSVGASFMVGGAKKKLAPRLAVTT
jgi:heme oxygenase